MLAINKKRALLNIGMVIIAFSTLQFSVVVAQGDSLKNTDNKDNLSGAVRILMTVKQDAYKQAEKVADEARAKLNEQKKLEMKKIDLNYDIARQKIKDKLQEDKATADKTYRAAVEEEQKKIKQAKENAKSKAELEKAKLQVEKSKIAADKARADADKAKTKAEAEAQKATQPAATVQTNPQQPAASVPPVVAPVMPATAN